MTAVGRVAAVVLAGVGVACIAGCGEGAPSSREGVVATLDGHGVTVARLESYFDGILKFEDDAEPLEGEELDRVRSRLFDAFIEEEILLREAVRRGVSIGDSEIEAYLGAAYSGVEETPEAAARAHERARRNLMIQKLRGAVVSVDSEVTRQEVDTYLAENRKSLEADRHVVLRSLMVGTDASATRVRREILRGEMAFAEAVEVFGLTPDQGQPMEVSLDDLPDEIRAVLAGLGSGEISEPVEFEGNTYLFLVDVGPAKQGEEDLRDLARSELLRIKSQEASDRFLERLRSQVVVEVHPENLPFDYIPD